MANYIDQYYEEVDSLHDRLRPSAFIETLQDPTPQDAFNLPLAPAGWVENADAVDGEAKVIINADGITVIDGKINVTNGADTVIEDGVVRRVENDGADVTIDENGITILNGAINLEDIGGQSVLTAAGFGGSWIDFLEFGTYNGAFGAGTLNAITAPTIVGTASTIADYNASLSDDIPYWVVEAKGGTGTMVRAADADASLGFCLKFTGTVNGTIFQDVPVVPGAVYSLESTFNYDNAVGSWEFQYNVYYSWRDENHAIIGSQASDGLVFSSGFPVENYQHMLHTYTISGLEVAPANARYLRVTHNITRNTGSIDVRIGDISVVQTNLYSLLVGLGNSAGIMMRPDPAANFNHFTLNAFGTMGWGDGTANEDAFIQRGDVARLNMYVEEFRVEESILGTGSPIVRIRGDSGDTGVAINDPDDTTARLFLGNASGVTPSLEFGGGSAARDVILDRGGADRLDLASGDSLRLAGSGGTIQFGTDAAARIGLGNAASAVDLGSVGNGAVFTMYERGLPGNAPADAVRIYLDGGGAGGKSRLMARFQSGAAVVVALEP